MSSFFDKIIPFFVGHRTEITALLAMILNILGATGVIPPHILDSANLIAAPLGLGFLAAKINRLPQDR